MKSCGILVFVVSVALEVISNMVDGAAVMLQGKSTASRTKPELSNVI